MPDEAPVNRIYVSAFFCQTVVRDKRDLLTAVRIVNTYTAVPYILNVPIGGVLISQTVYLPLTLQAVVTFLSDGPVEFDAIIKGFEQDGSELTPAPPPIRCRVQGGPEGHALNIAMHIPTHREADLRFDVYAIPVGSAVPTHPTTRMYLRINQGKPLEDPQPDQTQTSPAEASE
jgi:hypothetical protein